VHLVGFTTEFHFNTHTKVMSAVEQHTKIKPLIVNRFWPTDYERSVTYST